MMKKVEMRVMRVKKIKNVFLLGLIFIIIPLSHFQPVQAQTLAKVDISPAGVRDFFGVTNVQKGQHILVNVKIGVEYESPKSLDGFWLKIVFLKPDNTKTPDVWFDYTNEYISRGSEKSYTVRTGVLADQVGTWQVSVELYDKDKNFIISDSARFEVVESLPPPGEVGYLIVGGLVVAGALIALRR